MADWSSLPADLIARISDHVRGPADDLDHYTDFRVVCHAWRSATADPTADPRDPRFRPRRWAALDEVHQSDARLFVNLDTGRFVRKDMPMLRRYFLVAGVAGGQLVLAERRAPYAARVLNPFTGAMVRFKAPVPDEVEVVAHVIGPAPTLVLVCARSRHFYCADPDDKCFQSPRVGDNRFFDPMFWMAAVGSIHSYSAAGERGSYMSHFVPAVNTILSLMAKIFSSHLSAKESKAIAGGFVVESEGDMLAVFNLHRGRMKVFKIDTVAKAVEPVKDLGSRAIFLGDCRCLSVDVSKLASVDANCIYHVCLTEPSTLDFGVCAYSLKDRKQVTRGFGSSHPLTLLELLGCHAFNVRASQFGQAQQHASIALAQKALLGLFSRRDSDDEDD